MIIIFCLIFTSLLTSINVLSFPLRETTIDDNLFGTGIAVNVIQTLFTILLLYLDIFGKCSKITTDPTKCGNDCKWYRIAPPNFYKCTSLDITLGYAYIPIILLSSAYLLGFGIMIIIKSNDQTDDKEITTLSIASIIIGTIGILFIFSDIICNIGCHCG